LDDLYTVMARLVPGMLFLPRATDRDNSTAQLSRAEGAGRPGSG
jgi:hypothetical protein